MFLTIFTPIYNRERFLTRLYNSIKEQRCSDFEWIIIDDGSTDNSYEKAKQIQFQEKRIKIRVFKVKNGGKQRAINKAVKLAKGTYFFIVDSDDWLTSDALMYVKKWCKEIESLPNYNNYAGVSGLRISSKGKIRGGNGNGKEKIDCTNLGRDKYNLLGDKAEIYKTSILRHYPFKKFKNENFITEETVWNEIAAHGYIIRWHMIPIYVSDYLDDGLTRNKIPRDIKNYKGLTFWVKQSIELKKTKFVIATVGYYALISKKKKISFKKMAKNLNYPIGFIVAYYYIYIVYKKIKTKVKGDEYQS